MLKDDELKVFVLEYVKLTKEDDYSKLKDIILNADKKQLLSMLSTGYLNESVDNRFEQTEIYISELVSLFEGDPGVFDKIDNLKKNISTMMSARKYYEKQGDTPHNDKVIKDFDKKLKASVDKLQDLKKKSKEMKMPLNVPQKKSKSQNMKDTMKKLKNSSVGQISAGVAAAAVVAAAVTAGYRIYKRTMSKAAKACSSRSGSDKTACMKQYETAALKARLSSYQSAYNGCNKSRDPSKCKLLMMKKINNLKAKINKKAA